jgi:hypothetical protein
MLTALLTGGSGTLAPGTGFGAAEPWVTYAAADGPGRGKHIVLLAGDEEYRSEEALPMLARILARRHGFKCTVLFSLDANGVIDPNNQTNVPGLHQLPGADLAICQFRFRELPDADMKHFVDYLQAGKPLIALRTATHAFSYSRHKNSPYARFSWDSKVWPGGFGQQVLGDTWVSHHGVHGKESARGLVDGTHASHPVLRGVRDVWGPTDVYGIIRLKPTDTVLLHGLTLRGMAPTDPPNIEKTLMPLVWLRDYTWENGKTSRTLTSTIGAAPDLQSDDLRRLFINACYWFTGLEVPKHADAAYVGEFKPSFFGFGTFKKGVRPADHALAPTDP